MIKLKNILKTNLLKEQETPKEAFLDFGAKEVDPRYTYTFVKSWVDDSVENLEKIVKMYNAAIRIDKDEHDGNQVKKLQADLKEIEIAIRSLKKIKIKK
jgi:hypothetical protein